MDIGEIGSPRLAKLDPCTLIGQLLAKAKPVFGRFKISSIGAAWYPTRHPNPTPPPQTPRGSGARCGARLLLAMRLAPQAQRLFNKTRWIEIVQDGAILPYRDGHFRVRLDWVSGGESSTGMPREIFVCSCVSLHGSARTVCVWLTPGLGIAPVPRAQVFPVKSNIRRPQAPTDS